MAEPEVIESGGLKFDAAALDALLGEEPKEEEASVEEHETPVDEPQAEQTPTDEPQTEEVEASDEAEHLEESPDEEDQAAHQDDENEQESESAFITMGDEGPQLLTGFDDKNEPIYETADDLFGDHAFKIKAAGEEHEVTFAEMRQGYQRQADYTKSKTQMAETQRAMQPYVALLTLFEQDKNFQNQVKDYIQKGKEQVVSDDDILEAAESGDPDKLKAVLQRRKQHDERSKSLRAADTAAEQQRQQFGLQQHEIAQKLIPSYNTTVSNVKSFLTSLGYGEHEFAGFEQMDARLQNLAYLAYKQANPNSIEATDTKPGKMALQSKRKRIVKRPPKAVKAASGKSQTPQSRTNRQQKAAFRKAYKTRKDSDMVEAIKHVLPESLYTD